MDAVTKQCKGFGFVKFSNFDESQAAIREMQGSLLRGRAIKTSTAYMKNAATDSNMANLNTMFNPFAALAMNPFLLGMGGMGAAPNVAGYGAQPTQATQGYPAGMMGMPGMPYMGGVQQPYGAVQQAPTMQATGYGYPTATMGVDPNQGKES